MLADLPPTTTPFTVQQLNSSFLSGFDAVVVPRQLNASMSLDYDWYRGQQRFDLADFVELGGGTLVVCGDADARGRGLIDQLFSRSYLGQFAGEVGGDNSTNQTFVRSSSASATVFNLAGGPAEIPRSSSNIVYGFAGWSVESRHTMYVSDDATGDVVVLRAQFGQGIVIWFGAGEWISSSGDPQIAEWAAVLNLAVSARALKAVGKRKKTPFFEKPLRGKSNF